MELVDDAEYRLESSVDHLDLITCVRVHEPTPMLAQVHVDSLWSDENESPDVFWKQSNCILEDIEEFVAASTTELVDGRR